MRFKRIKDLREDNDKYQKEIAELLGISQQYYSEYENGKRTIPIQHINGNNKFPVYYAHISLKISLVLL